MGNKELIQGLTLYRLGQNGVETVTISKVGKQWFNYIDQDGETNKEQLKFIAPRNVKYSFHNTADGDRFFFSVKDLHSNINMKLIALESQLESIKRTQARYQEILAN